MLVSLYTANLITTGIYDNKHDVFLCISTETDGNLPISPFTYVSKLLERFDHEMSNVKTGKDQELAQLERNIFPYLY